MNPMLKNYYADVRGSSRIMMTFERSLNVLTSINDVKMVVIVLGLEHSWVLDFYISVYLVFSVWFLISLQVKISYTSINILNLTC